MTIIKKNVKKLILEGREEGKTSLKRWNLKENQMRIKTKKRNYIINKKTKFLNNRKESEKRKKVADKLLLIKVKRHISNQKK